MESNKTALAAVLLSVALVVGLIGIGLWMKADSDAQEARRANVMNRAFHDPTVADEPDRTPSLIAFGASGLMGLSAVILYAGAREEPERRREEAPPPEGRGAEF